MHHFLPEAARRVVHFTMSARMKSANSFGVPPIASVPCARNAVRTASALSASFAAADSFVHDRGRRSRRREKPDPDAGIVTGHAGLGQRRNIGQDRRPLRLRNGKRLQLARGNMRRQGCGDIEHQRDAAREEIRERLVAAALIGHHDDGGARIGIEQLRRHVACRGVAGRTEGQGFRLALRQRDQFLQIAGRHRWMRDQHVRNIRQKDDRREIIGEIETRFRFCRIERIGDGGHEQRIAVGRRTHHGFRCDHAAVAGAVLDHDRLTERGLHLLADDPGQNVGGRAGSEPDHDLDLLGPIGLSASRNCGRDRRPSPRRHKARTG